MCWRIFIHPQSTLWSLLKGVHYDVHSPVHSPFIDDSPLWTVVDQVVGGGATLLALMLRWRRPVVEVGTNRAASWTGPVVTGSSTPFTEAPADRQLSD